MAIKRRLKNDVKKKLQIFAVLFTLIVSVFFVKNYFGGNFSVVDANIQNAFDIQVIHEIIPTPSINRPMINREIKMIVIHETDNFSSTADAENHSEYLLTNLTDENSWHYTVDENVIYHHLPDHEVAWHAGDKLAVSGGNLNGIGVEICVNEGSNYDKSKDNAAKLVATLLDAYNLKSSDVYRHQHFSGKLCPAGMIDETSWQEFLDKIEFYMGLF